MRVLLLGPADSPLIPFLEQTDSVVFMDGPLSAAQAQELRPDWTVSYNYRHVIRPDTLRELRGRAVNLHISLLPWNRGADPNLWSIIDNTPAGVSIHYIDEGIDTGDVICQRRVPVHADDSLASSWDRLHDELRALFCDVWPLLRSGRVRGRRQPAGGSFHTIADRARVEHLLSDGWDTPVSKLQAERMMTG